MADTTRSQEDRFHDRLNRRSDQILVSGQLLDLETADLVGRPHDPDETMPLEVAEDTARQVQPTSLYTHGHWGHEPPAIVDALVREAAHVGASDIHIEAHKNTSIVRFRTDGVLHGFGEIGVEQAPAVRSRIKVLCDMDIAEKRRPQDGSFRFDLGGRSIDIRVSTMPSTFGEKVVLRLLDPQSTRLDIRDLGFSDQDATLFQDAIYQSQGMVLVTGPTGSGKTTSLYAALRQIRSPEVNIVTIEDPIEYSLEGINQSQVKPDIDYTFANALRAFLRQDPDVIMVGEIRDSETAQIALRAAMTGHLVLSTVHTNDAASTVTRLLDLGTEPFIVASSLSVIVAQRLLRRLCPACKSPSEDGGIRTFRAVGCPACKGSGYRGRVGIFEMLPLCDRIREMIHERMPGERIRGVAMENGMTSLEDAALSKLLEGITSRDEVQREIGEASR